MEIQNKKCSSNKHEINAISYCDLCKIYMCNKCSNLHSELFQDHQALNLNKEICNLFTGFCKEVGHREILNYFCKSHNTLCCAACISKIKSKGNGLHRDCEVCNIEEIKDEKKSNLEENIKCLEDLSKSLDKFIKELKIVSEEMYKNKEDIKLKIQKIFTQIRSALNEREDKLLSEVDNKFNDNYFKDDDIKNSEKLPNKIKLSLEKGKLIKKEWDNKDKLNSLINDCINIENNIKDIKRMNENINKENLKENFIKFEPEEKKINELLKMIQSFGELQLPNNSLGKLLKEEDCELISNWIKSDNQQIKKVEFKLCYDAKKNGDDKNNFHKFCDNAGPTLIVIKTESDYIFGGYTKENWESNHDKMSYKKDNTAFLFSLNNKERIKVKNGDRAIVNDNAYGPIFGHGNAYEICLFFPLLSKNVQIMEGGDYGNKNYLLTGNKSNKPIDIEIYKVSF